VKNSAVKPRIKEKSRPTLQKQIVKRKPQPKKVTLKNDPFFSSSPVDLGRTNNAIIDQILYGKNGK
jgi:hypothetical protein